MVYFKKYKALLMGLSMLLNSTHSNCNSTGVRLAQIPETGGSITESGNYYLGFDVLDQQLTIAADRVTLNLNGHTVGNISISGRQDVIITNGIVDGSSLTAGSGINITSSNNVHLSDIAVLNAGAVGDANGIGIDSSTNIFLSGLLVADSTSIGIRVSGGDNKGIFISDCICENNNLGIFISAGSSTSNLEVEVRRCLATGNTSHGFSVGENSERIYFFDCIARDNGGNGFQGSGASGGAVASFAALRCLAEANEYGFNAGANVIFIFEGCIARNNTNDGFDANGQTNTGLVKECTAISNMQCGFDNQGATTNDQPVTYVANYSAKNTVGQYCSSGVDNSGFPYCQHSFTNTDAQFWRNISAS